jgi:hypothetical protein
MKQMLYVTITHETEDSARELMRVACSRKLWNELKEQDENVNWPRITINLMIKPIGDEIVTSLDEATAYPIDDVGIFLTLENAGRILAAWIESCMNMKGP